MGGTGIVSTITGQRVFYAGGGGAGNYADGTLRVPSLGGAGGGGQGAYHPNDAIAGVANTGGGGGGGAGDFSGGPRYLAGAGGSGIVIIRYPATASPPLSTTGNPQISFSGGYQIYTWTSSGSITF
jgi:hypothetical protein